MLNFNEENKTEGAPVDETPANDTLVTENETEKSDAAVLQNDSDDIPNTTPEEEKRDVFSDEPSFIPHTPNQERSARPLNNQSGYAYTPPYQQAQPNQQRPAYQTAQPQYNTAYRQQNAYQQQAPQYNPAYRPMQENRIPQQPKKNTAGKKVLFAILAVAVIVASIALGAAIGRQNSKPTTSTTAQSDVTESTSNVENPNIVVTVESTKPNKNELSAVTIAENVRPSIVGIMSYTQGKLNGEGSGIIMCEDGGYTYIITCAHVISDKGAELAILLLDGTSYTAEMVGYDERTDIGVIKVEVTGLPVATFGDSSTLRIGETVYAIGNPGGSEYFGSMTSGIISAIDRSISSSYTMKVIQHDAAINPGNSGGALVNVNGQVIGINSSKIMDTDFEGMGFAVPMSTAKSVAESLIAHGYVPNRPKLGISYADVSAYQFYNMLVSIKGLPQGSLIISSISTDSDLANTDVKSGDLIIAVNGTNLDTADVLLDLIEKSSVGDTLTLTICRVDTQTYSTSTFDVKVKLVEDKGSTSEPVEEESTTSPYSYDYNFDESYEDFFRHFFGF